MSHLILINSLKFRHSEYGNGISGTPNLVKDIFRPVDMAIFYIFIGLPLWILINVCKFLLNVLLEIAQSISLEKALKQVGRIVWICVRFWGTWHWSVSFICIFACVSCFQYCIELILQISYNVLFYGLLVIFWSLLDVYSYL